MSATPPDPAAVLAAYRARRRGLEAERARLDEELVGLLRRYVAALLRERPGLNALAFSAYQDYDSSQLTGRALVAYHMLADDAWEAAGFAGECPVNELEPEVVEELEEALMDFWPSLQRLRGIGWCIAFWRDRAAEDGVATEQREHPGFG